MDYHRIKSFFLQHQASSPLEKLHHPEFTAHKLEVWIKRDDLLHPLVSGNKWRKLKYPVLQAAQMGFKGILSFGGAFSNHLHALAALGSECEFPVTAIVRGESSYRTNPTLSQIEKWGGKLEFVDRETYRRRHDVEYLESLVAHYPNLAIVAEGGSVELALKGVAETVHELPFAPQHILTPVGSGGTIAGLASGTQAKVTGIAAVRDTSLNDKIKQLLGEKDRHNWQLNFDYADKGFGKFSDELLNFMYQMQEAFQLTLEPIYTAKMFNGFFGLIKQGYFAPGSKVVLLHTGGLQGLKGLQMQGKVR